VNEATLTRYLALQGEEVHYYHTYNDKGVRTAMHSTGKKTKTAAVAFCMELYMLHLTPEFFNRKVEKVFIQIAQNLSRFSHSFREIWRFSPFFLPSFAFSTYLTLR
jgi:hypothetical protein